MRPVDDVLLPAITSVELQPGGYHVMLVGLRRSLRPCDRVQVRLRFERAGWREVTAEVRER